MSQQPSVPDQRLPNDVLISIVEELAHDPVDDNRRTIKACALLCHTLLPVCRKHIFHTFDMRKLLLASEQETILSRFYHFLSTNPHLIRYVRSVFIIDLTPQKWICNSPFLSSVIEICTTLTTFGLEGRNFNVLWNDAVHTMVSRECFTSLHLSEVQHIPTSFLNRCVGLKSLHLHRSSLTVPGELSQDGSLTEEEMPSIRPPPIYLEEISLQCSSDALEKLIHKGFRLRCSIDTTRLRRITVTLTEHAWSLIDHATRSLEYIHSKRTGREEIEDFMTGGSEPMLREHIELASFIHLQHFAFTLYMEDYEDLSERPLLLWHLLLRTAPPALRGISITIDFAPLSFSSVRYWLSVSSRSRRRVGTTETPTLLGDFDTILADRRLLPNISWVDIILDLPEDQDSDSMEYETDSEYGEDDGRNRCRDEDSDEAARTLPTLGELDRSVKRMMKKTRRRLGGSFRVSLDHVA